MLRAQRRQVHSLFEVGTGGDLGRRVDLFIMSLIAANIIAVILGTVDSLQTTYGDLFYAFEVFSVAVFTIEYLGRIWSCTAEAEYDRPIFGRIKYATSPYLVIDLLAILPFYVGFFLVDLRLIRMFRLFRFFRLFKLTRYSESMKSLGLVLNKKKEDLTVTVSAISMLLLISSTIMYYVENQAQPEVFSSIPAALWWGVATLTTVGYGDIYPITPLGKLFGAIIATLGVGLFALPASILASGFIEDTVDPKTCPHCGEQIDDHQGN